MLGLSGRTDIVIGTVPDPDLSAIRAVSVENDLQTAISNDPTWVSEMKSKVTGTDNRSFGNSGSARRRRARRSV